MSCFVLVSCALDGVFWSSRLVTSTGNLIIISFPIPGDGKDRPDYHMCAILSRYLLFL